MIAVLTGGRVVLVREIFRVFREEKTTVFARVRENCTMASTGSKRGKKRNVAGVKGSRRRFTLRIGYSELTQKT